MDAIQKALKKFNVKEREFIKGILMRLSTGKTQGFDIKKLKVRSDVFRIRKGDFRIIYRQDGKDFFVLLIERRNEKTYDF
jgi:mRNA-degrading endonuclease RelE of RelBE toxin-antitoxin system